MSAPARPGRARFVAVWLVLGLLVLGCALCGGVGVLAYGRRYELASGLDGELSTERPGWDPSRIGPDSRVIVGASLPATATGVRYVHTAGIDVCGVLRADVTEAEFRSLMAAAGLTPWSPTRTFGDDETWLGFSMFPGTPTPAWWAPPTTIDESVHVRQDGSLWRMARHDGRTLWFATVSH